MTAPFNNNTNQAPFGISWASTNLPPASSVIWGTVWPISNGGTGVTGTPTNGQLLIGNGSGYALATLTAGTNITITDSAGGIMIAASGGGGGGTVNSGTANQLTYYAGTGTAVSGNANATISGAALTLGVSATATGSLILAGSTSGAVTIQPNNTAGTWTMTLPATAGTNTYVLTTNGSGVTSWSAPTSGGNVTGPGTSTNTGIARYSGTGGTVLLDSGVLVDGSNNVSGIVALSSGAHAITSASAASLVVGPNGATNPALTVNSSTSSAATGISIKSAAAASGITLQVTSSGSAESMSLAPKSSGDIIFAMIGGNVRFRQSSADLHTFNAAYYSGTPGSVSTASQVRFGYTAAADTTLTAGTESPFVYFNGGVTRQHASNTAITLQRDFRITGTTHSFVNAGGTITDCTALSIDGAPIGGTNATITNSHAIYIPTIALSNVTNGYGISVAAPSGAGTLNAAINATGDVLVAGNVKLGAAGNKLFIKEGSNAAMGVATLSGGTVTVNTTAVTANSRIFLSVNGGTLTNVGFLDISTRSAGTSFTITSSNIADTSTVAWIIIEPA